MKNDTRALVIQCSSAALALSALATDVAAQANVEWELKGLHLGASVADVQSAFPTAVCDVKPHDPGLTFCLDRENTLGGAPAFLAVKLLDGKAVDISLDNLTYDQMRAAIPTLIERFGEPEYSESLAKNILQPRGERTVVRVRYVWTGADDVVVVASPFDWSNEQRRITYSSINLMSEAKQKEWGERFNAKVRATDL